MKIGYLRLDHGEWTNGSYNTQEVGLAKAYAKLGHEVTIFYCVYENDPKLGTEVEITTNVRKYYLPAKSFGHHALINPKILDKFELDLLHIQGDNLLRVPDVVRYCKKRKLPCYCYVGRLDSEKTGKLHRFLADMMVRRNIITYKKNPVFVKTPSVKMELDPKNKKENIVIAPVGLDMSIIPNIKLNKKDIRIELGIKLDSTVVTCVCGLRAGKRPYDIFELAKHLDDSTQIVFIGGWDQETEKQFEQRIRSEGLADRFRYINRIPNSEIHNYYIASDYVVNFNPNEIFGMAILEAMYQRCTVVARRAPGPEFIIENKKSGYIVDSIEEMAQVITSKQNVSENARNRVIENFSWDKTAGIILNKMRLK